MRKDDALAVDGERRKLSKVVRVRSSGQRQLFRLGTCNVIAINNIAAIDIADEQHTVTVRRKATRALLPCLLMQQRHPFGAQVVERSPAAALGSFDGQ